MWLMNGTLSDSDKDRQLAISVIVPFFNEAAILTASVTEIESYLLRRPTPFELLLVDDGSTDGGGALADDMARDRPSIRVVHHPINRGLGAAIRTGLSSARAEVSVVLDADLTYAPYHIDLLTDSLEETQAAIAVASPYLRGGAVCGVPWMRRMLSSWANRYLSIATGGELQTLTGMVRAYRTSAVRTLDVRGDGMEFNHRLLFAALRTGLQIVEVPACLDWKVLRGATASRRSSMRVLNHCLRVVADGLAFRPSLLLAIPGLAPGVLPLAAALLLALHIPHGEAAKVAAAVVGVQLASLGFLALITGRYVRRTLRPSAWPRAPLESSRHA
jgi:hypothetical protein